MFTGFSVLNVIYYFKSLLSLSVNLRCEFLLIINYLLSVNKP